MMRTLKHILPLAFLLMLSVAGCDEATLHKTVSDITTDVDPYAGMVLIPAGEVTIGAPLDEIPEVFFLKGVALRQQAVFVDDFYIDTHEVTYAEFLEFVETTGSDAYYRWTKETDHPVETNFQGAKSYAEWAGKRLPTETEWEKAARGGLVDVRYPWGNEFPTDAHARLQGEQYRTDIVNGPVAVGSYPPNAYGLHDVAGNVSEWVDASAIQGRQPVYGGSWLSGSSWFCRVYIRELRPPKTSNGHGFRCATDAN